MINKINKKERKIFGGELSTGTVSKIIRNLQIKYTFKLLHYPIRINSFNVNHVLYDQKKPLVLPCTKVHGLFVGFLG